MRLSKIPSNLWIGAQLALLAVSVAFMAFIWATLSFMWPIWKLSNDDQNESKPNENDTDNYRRMQEFINSVRHRMYNYAEQTLDDLGQVFWPKRLTELKESIMAISNPGNQNQLNIQVTVHHEETAKEEEFRDSFEWPEVNSTGECMLNQGQGRCENFSTNNERKLEAIGEPVERSVFGDTSQEEICQFDEQIAKVHFHPALLEMLQKFDRSNNQDQRPVIHRPVTINMTPKLKPLMTPSVSLKGTNGGKSHVNWSTVTKNGKSLNIQL